jgi:hypothetical protein
MGVVVATLAVSTKSNKKQVHTQYKPYKSSHVHASPRNSGAYELRTGIGEAPADPSLWVSHRQKSCFFWMMMACGFASPGSAGLVCRLGVGAATELRVSHSDYMFRCARRDHLTMRYEETAKASCQVQLRADTTVSHIYNKRLPTPRGASQAPRNRRRSTYLQYKLRSKREFISLSVAKSAYLKEC